MKRWSCAGGALAATLFALEVSAQAADPSESAAPEEPTRETEESVEEMVEELLTSGQAEEDDLAWLYSDDVYEPSDLGGRPIPAPPLPERGEGTPRTWDPAWRKFGLGNYILTGAAFAVSVGSTFIPPAPERWQSRNSVDESVQGAIGIENFESGVWARDASDLVLSVTVAFPLLIDSLVITYWYRNSHDVAGQMGLITAEALAVATAVHGLTSGFASRERPYVRDCGVSIDETLDDCNGRKPYRSFFSGHTVMSFAGAGVTCSHHWHHDVFGDEVADNLACGTAMLAAAATGTLRIVGNQHYLSDVVMGATVGTLSGIGVPWLLHYGAPARLGGVGLELVPVANGLGVGGKF